MSVIWLCFMESNQKLRTAWKKHVKNKRDHKYPWNRTRSTSLFFRCLSVMEQYLIWRGWGDVKTSKTLKTPQTLWLTWGNGMCPSSQLLLSLSLITLHTRREGLHCYFRRNKQHLYVELTDRLQDVSEGFDFFKDHSCSRRMVQTGMSWESNNPRLLGWLVEWKNYLKNRQLIAFELFAIVKWRRKRGTVAVCKYYKEMKRSTV